MSQGKIISMEQQAQAAALRHMVEAQAAKAAQIETDRQEMLALMRIQAGHLGEIYNELVRLRLQMEANKLPHDHVHVAHNAALNP